MNNEQQRAAIVTGASHGIGAAVAERLAHDGFAVVINYSSGSDQADTLVAKIEAAGGKAIAVKADVSDPAAVKAVFDAAEQAFGGVDVLVNNAGVMRLTPIAEADDDAFDTTIAVNLKGTFNGLREGARRLYATAVASLASHRASSASTSRPTRSMPPRRPASRR
jgi:3-oxoacyl-[acyl-carrier protein] reductase